MQLVTMDFLKYILYSAILKAIHVWRMFLYILAYILFNPVKKFAYQRLHKLGVGTEGKEPDDMIIHNEWSFHRLAYGGTLGFIEAYIDGWWDCKKLDELLFKIFRRGIFKKVSFPWDGVINYLQYDLFNLQTLSRSYEVAAKHYDLGK